MDELKFSKALNYSFLLLKYRARSKNEILTRLRQKGCSPSIAAKTINYLKEYGYIDDKVFVEVYRAGALEKGWGPRRLDYNLKKLGISSDLRKQALEGIDQRERIRAIVEKKLIGHRNKNDITTKKILQKIARSLAVKGFDYSDIFYILNEVEVSSFEDK